ncbi:sensor domain-containing diguanylate cyclase [Caenispirillum bisanense]|uniref:PAS domain S-box-containing protein/diguanylate cyclase (GGDEF) domain-containing protein n=1 Tax=Caenispirillum bisanense TaxID=414052 RepID=A0A286GNC8_9PROT|nr:diguanylate cyclase [Caenispirillum bisanense]SOD97002.1 PAS domain S-box-containing protein/diguanylate cyclase (GGDEF) domain-containing protein [Caenispirillum bisanense]
MLDTTEGITFDISQEALDAHGQPCAVIDATAAAVMLGRAFRDADGLTDDAGLGLAPAVQAALGEALAAAAPATRVMLDTDAGKRVYDLFLLPPDRRGHRLVLASDRTMDSGLRNALTESRARYKDLVEISSEHAWEVDADGAFSFVAPQGLLGYAPRRVIGLPAGELLDPERHTDPINPFATPVPLEGRDVWVRAGDGSLCCLEVTAVPLFDADNRWAGARGVCRDVTEQRRREQEMAEARARERVFGRIVRLFQREVKPENMIRAAASAITHGMAATGCQIFGIAAPLAKVVQHPTFQQETAFGRIGSDRDADRLIAALESAGRDAVVGDLVGDRHLIGTLCMHGDRINGAIVVWREADRPDFGQAERRLLAGIAGTVGVALEQLYSHRVLVEVSRTDGLTGLLNRRAFYEDMQRRVRRLARGERKAALMYVDLDNFKAVNDTWGHETGDKVLRDVADLLRANTRSTDMVARLGGDEFAVWLDDADETVAVKRAEVFLAASAILKQHSARPDLPLMLSIGIAVYDPVNREDMNEFVSRADGAMYAIKRKGKGSYAVARQPGRRAP